MSTHPVRVFCDRLAPGAVLALVWMRLRRGVRSVMVLDGPPSRIGLALLRTFGLSVEEASFFTGHLRTDEGEAVYVEARRRATPLLFEAADRLIGESARLRQANEWGRRNTVRLFLARFLWTDLEPAVARILVARALSGGRPSALLLPRPQMFDPRVLASAFAGQRLCFYRSFGLRSSRAGLMARALMSTLGRELRWMLFSWRRAAAALPRPTRPALLLLQEDDLSMDRSRRSQPHWRMPHEPAPDFETYVLPRNRSARLPADEAALRAAGIVVLDDERLAAARRYGSGNPTDREFAARCAAVGRAALVSRRTRTAVALVAVWGLLSKARSLAAWCEQLGVRAFLTGENYPVESDAMQLVAERTGVQTLAFQYSNLPFSTPVMMTTADRLLLFSKSYAPLWAAHGIAPRRTEELGYLFDGAFRIVAERASVTRESLRRAGASFVLCYFDESVQTDKYGLISDADHRDELQMLARALLDDGSLGLVVKTQFERNAPSRRYAGDPVFEQARATGRYLELGHGVHRNTVFPAEAALSADFAIGHIVGATAALEAALAGRRCALLNPYGMRSLHDALYASASIVVPAMPDLLHALKRLRAGDPAFASFGDWSRILPHFDPWRDGRAASRLRACLDELFAATRPASAGAA